jgi:hypothetical protein
LYIIRPSGHRAGKAQEPRQRCGRVSLEHLKIESWIGAAWTAATAATTARIRPNAGRSRHRRGWRSGRVRSYPGLYGSSSNASVGYRGTDRWLQSHRRIIFYAEAARVRK